MSLKAKLEAVIYASEEPVTLAQLAALFAGEALELKAEQEAAAAKAAEQPDADAEQISALPQFNEAFPFLELEPVEATQPAAAGEADVPSGADATPDAGANGAGAAVEEPAAKPSGGTVEATNEGGTSAEAAEESTAKDELSPEAEAKQAAKMREREARAVIRQLLEELVAAYAAEGRGIEIREIAGGYRMATKPECHDAVRSFVKSQKPALKLSLPALETLAVIAYKQPVTAPEVNEIRGVDSSGVFGSLLARKLITTAGRKQVVGRPILYKTTREFLLRFGLKDVTELPSMEEFEKMAASELEESETPAVEEVAALAADEFNPDPSVEQNAPAPEAESESNPQGTTQIDASAPGDTE
jgi:segregation and condensation protein B